MNGYQADAVDLIALNGLGAEILLPLGDEGVDARGILAGEVEQLVVEGAEIGILSLQTMELEEGVETFRQLI